MGVLDRLGLASSRSAKKGKPTRAGIRLEGRSAEARTSPLSRRQLFVCLGLFAGLVILGMLAFPSISVYDGSARVGDVWRSDDIVAPYDFAIRLPENEIAARRDSVRRAEPAVFGENETALDSTLVRLSELENRMQQVTDAYVAWRLAAEDSATSRSAAAADSARYRALHDSTSLSFTPSQWMYLLASALDAEQRRGVTPLAERLTLLSEETAREALARGVLNVPRDSVTATSLIIRNENPRDRTEREVERASVLALDEAYGAAREAFRSEFPQRPDTVQLGLTLFESAFEPSLVFRPSATHQRLQEALALVQPTRGRVKRGITIIRRGDEVTPERHAQLRSLAYAQRERSGDVNGVQTLFGRALLLSAALALFFLYLYVFRRSIVESEGDMVLITLLLAGTLVGFWIATTVGGEAPYAVPVALTTILLAVIYDSRLGSFATISLAALAGLMMGYNFEVAFATLFVGVMAVFSVRDVKNRSQLLLSAAVVFGAYLVVVFGYALLRSDPFSGRLVEELVAVSVNAVLLLLAAPVLYAIEKVFAKTTDLTLLELSDTNRPLLKELSLRAPGTFNHSMQVANLAEAAADAVGANALRARVGALYHDIGKMKKPEYFIENQQPGENPHEKCTPFMSALILGSHVKDGEEIGREHSLPQPVLDFVRTHHGTGLMEYFYRQAMEQAQEVVDENEFRYPGPRPLTREQAIVMLADSSEAASRSLDKPTPRRLQNLLDGIFRARVEDDQLDESPITFSELETIKQTFLSVLSGIYHFRVKYPDQDGGDAEAASVEEREPASAQLTGTEGREETHPRRHRAGLDVHVPDSAGNPSTSTSPSVEVAASGPEGQGGTP